MVKRYWKIFVFLFIESILNSYVNLRIGIRILKFFNVCLGKKWEINIYFGNFILKEMFGLDLKY